MTLQPPTDLYHMMVAFDLTLVLAEVSVNEVMQHSTTVNPDQIYRLSPLAGAHLQPDPSAIIWVSHRPTLRCWVEA